MEAGGVRAAPFAGRGSVRYRVAGVFRAEVSTMTFHTMLHKRTAFTLIELLVVVAIIALLISILLPSLRAAREEAAGAACMSNEKQIVTGIFMYQDEYNGYVPPNAWSESAWGVEKKDLWFYKLTPYHLQNPDVFICPGDPFRETFDYEAYRGNGAQRCNANRASCGYGLNYLLRHFWEPWSFNIVQFPPSRPEATILFAEVGPDFQPIKTVLYGGAQETTRSCVPWRDGGRLVWDDGARPWINLDRHVTWLTARHRGGINLAAMDGSVRRADTRDMLHAEIKSYYPHCATGDCYFCNYHPSPDDQTHYDFSHVELYWWTGRMPDYPSR